MAIHVSRSKNNKECSRNKNNPKMDYEAHFSCPCCDSVKCLDCAILDNPDYISNYGGIKEVA